jgi:F-type H+-transporting ATPase subunit delta
MNASLVRAAARYANAFCSIDGAGRAVIAQLSAAAAALEGQEFLLGPFLSEEEKLEIVREVFASEPLVRGLLEVLIKAKRINILSETARQAHILLNEKEGVGEAQIAVAFMPPDELKNKILSASAAILKVKQVTAEFKEDKTLIGGFTVKTPEITADCSVRGQLERMKENLIK